VPENIRVGIIGAGANTWLRHIPGFGEIDDVEVVAVANRTTESGRRTADKFGIPTVHDHWTDLIDDLDIDAVCIGTWPYMHSTITIAALEAGKHVMTEARMAMDAEEAHDMLAASAERPELVTQIVPSPFTLGVDRTVKRLIAEGYLGDLLSVDLTSHSGGFLDGDGPMHWRYDRDMSGHNVMLMGIWYEALMRWIGPATSVTALGRTHVTGRKDADGAMHTISIPDHVEVIAEFASGPMAHLRLTSVTGHAPGDRVWLYGSEGTLRVDTAGAIDAEGLHIERVTLSGGRRGDAGLGPIEIPDTERSDWRVEEEFVGAIRGTEPIRLTSFTDGVKYMEFTEAVYRSSQERAAAYLPL
jgi:predicted dehydrogenase